VELIAIETWLFATLNGDDAVRESAPAGVHPDLRRPQGAPLHQVAVVWSMTEAGEEDRGMCGTLQAIHPLYLVRATAQTRDMSALGPAADAVHALLENAVATLTIGGVDWKLMIEREGVYRQPSFSGGLEYFALGGQYRCHLLRRGV
jgi:hypothetical protein